MPALLVAVDYLIDPLRASSVGLIPTPRWACLLLLLAPKLQTAVLRHITPLPLTGMLLVWLPTGYKGASDLYIDANIQLAIAAGKQVSLSVPVTAR